MGTRHSRPKPLPRSVTQRLRCPRCRSPLSGDLSALLCERAGCELAFGSLDGIPALFDEEASLFSAELAERSEAARASQSLLRRKVDDFLPSLDRNVSVVGNLEKLSGNLLRDHARPVLLNIGDKHPSSASMALRANPSVEVVELDVRPSGVTNILADPIRLPFEDETFDCVIAIAVLEHIIDPVACVAEIHRVLKPGGLVYSDAPFMLEVHAGAFDYQRFTAVGHRNLFREFEELDSGVTQGPGVALSHSIQSFLLSFVHRNYARFAVKAFCRVTLFWLRYIDIYLGQQPGAKDCAMGTYFTGKKDGRIRTSREVLESYAGITPDLYPGRPSRTSAERAD